MNAVRAPAVVILLALLVGAVVFAVDPAPVEVGTRPPAAHTELSLDGSTGDVWFCLGPAAGLAGIEEAMIVITSLLDEPTEGIVTVVDERGGDVERSFRLDAGEQLTVRADQTLVGSEFAGVTVEAPAGRVLVEQHLRGVASTGVDRRSCTTATAGSWQLPWATTERPGTRQVLLLHNPFRAIAVADLRFVGDIGRRETLDSQGVVVPGRSVVAYDVTGRIADSEVVSTTVDVRVGHLMVARLQISDGSGPQATRGIDLAPGVPEQASRAFVPGVARSGAAAGGSAVVVVNAGLEPVEAEVVVRTAAGDVPVEPWRLVLRAGQRHAVALDDGRLDGIGAFGVEVRTVDARPVAASVVQRADDGAGGLVVRPAVAVAARGWVVDLDDRYGATDDVLAVLNPAPSGIATIQVKVLAGSAPEAVVRTIELYPGAQVSFDLEGGPPAVLAVEATAPVVVSVHRRGGGATTGSTAVAVAGTEALPAPSR